MLLLHLVSAIISLAVCGVNLFKPNHSRINLSYVLIAATFASGTILVVQTHSALLSACEAGIVYLAISLGCSFAAARKLARQEN